MKISPVSKQQCLSAESTEVVVLYLAPRYLANVGCIMSAPKRKWLSKKYRQGVNSIANLSWIELDYYRSVLV